jgi:hypothetical protein
MEFQDIREGLAALTSGFSLIEKAVNGVRTVVNLLPNGKEKARIEKTIEEAEQQSKFAEVRIAQALGFQLCPCTFPPPIMRGIGYHGTERSQVSFQCLHCRRIWPPDRPSPRPAAVDYDPLNPPFR